MYTHPRTGDRIRTCDPRVKSQKQLLFISVAGNLNTLLYQLSYAGYIVGYVNGIPSDFPIVYRLKT